MILEEKYKEAVSAPLKEVCITKKQ